MKLLNMVASFSETWIEIYRSVEDFQEGDVASFSETWIEI